MSAGTLEGEENRCLLEGVSLYPSSSPADHRCRNDSTEARSCVPELSRAQAPPCLWSLWRFPAAPRGPPFSARWRVPSAATLERRTGLEEPVRIDFTWSLNESGSRLSGRGVARAEPPYKARLDLFLDDGESVLSAALVDDELRLPYGARDDILPPVDLIWATLGVFRPVPEARLVAGDRLDDGGERLRYLQSDGTELHYETVHGVLRSVEMLERGRVVQWIRVEGAGEDPYPLDATYRNNTAFRELKMTRTGLRVSEPFDPRIWDPRE